MDATTRDLLAARDGDRPALARWIRAAQPDVWRWAAAAVGPDRADDLTQDVLLRAMRALPSFRGDASARTWVLAIARRALADELRQRYRRDALRERLRGLRPDTGADPAELLEGRPLEDAVRSLDPDRRDAFVLTQLLGLRYDEAAEALDVPVGTVRSRVARARMQLVDVLDERRPESDATGA